MSLPEVNGQRENRLPQRATLQFTEAERRDVRVCTAAAVLPVRRALRWLVRAHWLCAAIHADRVNMDRRHIADGLWS